MAVGLKVDMFWYPIGTGSFLHSFFSTICFNLENSIWGNRFPILMNELYSGDLNYNNIDSTIEELITIQNELKNYPPEKVVWDIDDLTKLPPWKDKISKNITDLSNYFVTSDGKDLFKVLFSALDKAKSLKTNIAIISI